jgi:histone deacetylase 1/2
MNSPTDVHAVVVKHILCYLKGTINDNLNFIVGGLDLNVFTTGTTDLTAFYDADYAGNLDDRRSFSDFCIFLGLNPITWSVKKQLMMSLSTIEAEYRSLLSTAAKLCWLSSLMTELNIPIHESPIIYCNNQFAIALAFNLVFHAWTKHIAVDYHFIREKIASGQLSLEYVPTDEQVADIFTKRLSLKKLEYIKNKLQLVSES